MLREFTLNVYGKMCLVASASRTAETILSILFFTGIKLMNKKKCRLYDTSMNRYLQICHKKSYFH